MDSGDPSGLTILATLLFTLVSAAGMIAASGLIVRLMLDRVQPDAHKVRSLQEEELRPPPYVSPYPGDPRSRLPHDLLFEIELERARAPRRR